MALLDKAQIVQADDLAHEDVEVPEWGGTVRVRTLTGAERDAFEAESFGEGGKQLANVRARLVARCLIGEDGERLFDDQTIDALGAKSARALDRVFAVASRLNGLTEADIEDLEKN